MHKRTLARLVFCCTLFLAGVSFPAIGQENESPKRPPPDQLSRKTKDGVHLRIVYFEGNAGKKTVPVILVHGTRGPMGEGSSRDCMVLASFLQQRGHAVFVPDLRGYGDSNKQVIRDESHTLLPSRFRRQDIQAMIDFDLEAVKKLIVEKHNAGKLNAELLCVIGFEMGAAVAINWTHLDWNIPSYPNLKQGQDVKAMVLVSPLQAYKGVTIREAMADPAVRGKISAMLIYGSQSPKVVKDCRRIFRSLERSHQPIPDNEKERREKQDLFRQELATSLQGTRLLTGVNLGVNQMVAEFIQIRLVAKNDLYPWKSRVH